MKKYFSKEDLSFYKGQVNSITTVPNYFQALLVLYDKLYTEIISWGTNTANLTLGFIIVLFTGIFYGITATKHEIFVLLPPLFGLLCIFSNLVFIWMGISAYKMAEIEICLQKTKMLLFNWQTKHNVLSRSYTAPFYLVATIISFSFLIFLIGLIYTLTRCIKYHKIYEKDSKILLEFNYTRIILIGDLVLFLLAIFTIYKLYKRYRLYKNKMKELTSSL